MEAEIAHLKRGDCCDGITAMVPRGTFSGVTQLGALARRMHLDGDSGFEGIRNDACHLFWQGGVVRLHIIRIVTHRDFGKILPPLHSSVLTCPFQKQLGKIIWGEVVNHALGWLALPGDTCQEMKHAGMRIGHNILVDEPTWLVLRTHDHAIMATTLLHPNPKRGAEGLVLGLS